MVAGYLSIVLVWLAQLPELDDQGVQLRASLSRRGVASAFWLEVVEGLSYGLEAGGRARCASECVSSRMGCGSS